MNSTRKKQTSLMGLASYSVLAILAGGWPAKAQMCPAGTAIPLQTIKIFNDTAQQIYAELEVGNNPDLSIQTAMFRMRTKTSFIHTRRR